jgi:hypothetical protein
MTTLATALLFVMAVVLSTNQASAAVGTPAKGLVWFNPTSGEVGVWQLDGTSKVKSFLTLDTRCDAASGCSNQWHPVDVGDVDKKSGTDLLWFNSTTGEVGAWLLDGTSKVKGFLTLNTRCDAASGCSNQWIPVALR